MFICRFAPACPCTIWPVINVLTFTICHVQVAIKFVERRDVARNQKNIRREIVNHSLLMHPHIIQFQRWQNRSYMRLF